MKSRAELLDKIRSGGILSTAEQLWIAIVLSLPAIVAQLSSILMQYIDASMVGSLGTQASASIGLMATSTWLFWGLCTPVAMGFSVQVSHLIGANKTDEARSVLRQSFVVSVLWSALLALTGVAISGRLPVWLGGSADITRDATAYFIIFVCSLPVFTLGYLGGAMLRCSGNTLVPGIVSAAMCVLDVIFNALLIFPTRQIDFCGLTLTIPGADLKVIGAALGTALAEVVTAIIMLWYLWFRSRELRLAATHGSFRPRLTVLRKAFRIGAPLGAEHAMLCGAQIITTAIVAPLGAAAIAANAFGVTAESLCYMPGYGISEAATTLVGQSLGAGRRFLARRFAYITVTMGIAIMTIMGVLMYMAAPFMMGIITPVEEICRMGVEALRIEAFAEPMFAASIVAYGAFVGASDTIVPCCMNLGSMWCVRLTLAALLAPTMGLNGVWMAMAIELCCRGIIFLIRLRGKQWINVYYSKI